MRDDLIGRRSAPLRLVLRGVGIADQCRVVPSRECAVQRRSDARVGLGTDDEQSSHRQVREHGLEVGVLEGVAVALRDERLGVARRKLRNDTPVVAALLELLVRMLDPDNRYVFPARLLDDAFDVRDNRVALERLGDDPVRPRANVAPRCASLVFASHPRAVNS